MMIRSALAFLKRDLLVAWSYRLGSVGHAVGMLFTVLVFFFMGRLITPLESPQLQAYGGDYFAFSLVGLAFADYLVVSVNSFSEEIRRGQVQGSFEALLSAPIHPLAILLYSSVYPFFFTTIRVAFYLIAGVTLFGMRLQMESPFLFLLVFILTICSFWGIGLFSAAFVIVFKQTSPIAWALGPISGLLGGVMFPVTLLPEWLAWAAQLIPMTWALEALRQILLNGAAFSQVWRECAALGAFAVILLAAGVIAFRYGLRHAQREGSLLHY